MSSSNGIEATDNAQLLADYRMALMRAERRIDQLERSLAVRLGRVVIQATVRPWRMLILPYLLLRERRRWLRRK